MIKYINYISHSLQFSADRGVDGSYLAQTGLAFSISLTLILSSFLSFHPEHTPPVAVVAVRHMEKIEGSWK